MAKIPQQRKPRKKSKPKKAPLKLATKHKRGTRAKSITFSKGKKDPDKIIKSLEVFNWNKFNYLRMKNKPNGKNHKPPQGITVIITIKQGRNLYYFTRQSPYDFVVNKQSIKDFTIEKVRELTQQWENLDDSMMDEDAEPEGFEIGKKGTDDPENLDPARIQDITIRFFYGKDPNTGEKF